ncbi:MAG: ribonuclease III family protein [Candidatus Kariarchaeaceae archaeon]|jgi:ribonuclease-3
MDDMIDPKLRAFMDKFGIDLPHELIRQAFTHPSCKTDPKEITSYERLETLGDSVLDLIVLKKLMIQDTQAEPGELSRTRSILVNNDILFKLGEFLGIRGFLRTAQGYSISQKDLADAVEGIFGALYLHRGIRSCEDFLAQCWDELVEFGGIVEGYSFSNPIGHLQELMQKNGHPLPQYSMVNKEGSDHRPIFTMQCELVIDGQSYISRGNGKNLQRARVAAAIEMVRIISLHSPVRTELPEDEMK